MFKQAIEFFKSKPWKLSYKLPMTKNGTFIEYFRPTTCSSGLSRRTIQSNDTEFLACFNESGQICKLNESTPLGEICTVFDNGIKRVFVRTEGTPQLTEVTNSPQLNDILSSIRVLRGKTSKSSQQQVYPQMISSIRSNWTVGNMGW